MKTVKLLLFSVALFLPCLLFHHAHQQAGEQIFATTLAMESAQILQNLEKISASSDVLSQANALTERFSRLVGMDQAAGMMLTKAISRRYRSVLRHHLPRHEAFLVQFTATGPRIISRSLSGMGSDRFILPSMRIVWESFEKNTKLSIRERFASDSHLLRETGGFPIRGIGAAQKDGAWQSLATIDGQRLLFWQLFKAKVPERQRIVIAVFLDAASFTPEFAPMIQTLRWRDESSGLAFLPPSTGSPPIGSVFFRFHQDAVRLLRPGVLPRSRAPMVRQIGGYLVGIGPGAGRKEYLPVFIRPFVDSRNEGARNHTALLLLFVAFALATIGVAVQKAVLLRTFRLSVFIVILSGFLVSSLIPLSGAKMIIERFLGEEYRRENRQFVEEATADMQRLDGSVPTMLASFVAHIRTSPQRLQLFSRSASEENSLASIAERLGAAAGIPLDRVVIFRPGSRSRLFSFHGGPIPTCSEEKKDVSNNFFGRRFRNYVAWRDASRPDLPKFIVDSISKGIGVDLDATEDEIVREVLLESLGLGPYLSFALYPNRVHLLEIPNGNNLYFGMNMPGPSGSSYFLEWFGQKHFIGLFRKALFRNMEDREASTSENLALFLGEKSITAQQAIGRNTPHPALCQAALEAMELHTPSQLVDRLLDSQTGRSHRRYFAAIPARNFPGAIGIQKSMEPIDTADETRREIAQNALMMLVLAFAVIAILGALSFLTPLRALITALRAIGRQDYNIRLDESRGDEFGSISSAFNLLAQGLREGSILKRFVSDSVRRAVQRDASETVDKTAELGEATILFSHFHEFDEYQQTRPTAEIFAALDRHLEAFALATRSHGGEIDKTIADKIMVVFRHTEMGGGPAAVRAAFAVVDEVRQRFSTSGEPLTLAIGINSGMVISGILGAANVRLDHTVIGDPVNLAARLSVLAEVTSGTRVVVSGMTRRYAEAHRTFTQLPFKRVKGKTQEVEAFQLDATP